jgi:hypothetical protein
LDSPLLSGEELGLRVARLARARAGDVLGVALVAAREDGLRFAALRVVALLVVALPGAGRVLEAADEAMFRTCRLSSSRRFIAFSRSACRAVRSTRFSTCLIAAWIVFWPSLTAFSTCLRTSGGNRL